MINLAAAIRKRKLSERNCSSSSDVKRREQGCILDGDDLVLLNILKRLPVECLMKCKSVSRRWRHLIKHEKYLIDSHFTSSETRLRSDEKSFLLYPSRAVNGTVPIKKFLVGHKELSFDDGQGHELSDTATTVVTSNNVTLDKGQIFMLEPVQGLVCFVTIVKVGLLENCPSVLIYNPSTRVKTPWIETSSSEVFGNLVGIKPVVFGNRQEKRIFRASNTNKYIFGFGIDPTTNKHKVICIYKNITRRKKIIVSRELVCGVLTVGVNTWRKIDQIPPDTAINKNSVHVGGSIYWISNKKLQSQNGIIVVFDLGSETFRSIRIPSFVLDLWSSIKTRKLVNELAEIDGHLGLLVRDHHDMLYLWLYNVDKDSSDTDDNWVKETMQLPCRWDDVHNIAFKAVAGTSLVVLKISKELQSKKKFHCEFLRYYDRREKKYYRNQSVILWEPAGTCGVTYSIAPFYDTLLPV